MSELPTDPPQSEPADEQPISRREILQQGAKLAYVTPAVLVAMSAAQTAAAESAKKPEIIRPRLLNVVPADVLDLIEEVEREGIPGA